MPIYFTSTQTSPLHVDAVPSSTEEPSDLLSPLLRRILPTTIRPVLSPTKRECVGRFSGGGIDAGDTSEEEYRAALVWDLQQVDWTPPENPSGDHIVLAFGWTHGIAVVDASFALDDTTSPDKDTQPTNELQDCAVLAYLVSGLKESGSDIVGLKRLSRRHLVSCYELGDVSIWKLPLLTDPTMDGDDDSVICEDVRFIPSGGLTVPANAFTICPNWNDALNWETDNIPGTKIWVARTGGMCHYDLEKMQLSESPSEPEIGRLENTTRVEYDSVRRVALCCSECSVMIYDQSLGLVDSIRPSKKGNLRAFLIDEDKNRFAVSSTNGDLYLFDIRKLASPMDCWTGLHRNGIYARLCRIDERRIVTGGDDNFVRVWDFDKRKLLKERATEDQVYAVEKIREDLEFSGFQRLIGEETERLDFLFSVDRFDFTLSMRVCFAGCTLHTWTWVNSW